jgi:deazaflavin-dependent oxidoreductase (nitroreductase family)
MTSRVAGSRARRAAEPEFLYLTTTGRRTGLPREIEIWFTRRGDRFHLIAETGERAQWVRNVRADPTVRWRVGARAFTGRARVVDRSRETARAAAVRTRFQAKYGWDEGLIVELRPRTARPGRS